MGTEQELQGITDLVLSSGSVTAGSSPTFSKSRFPYQKNGDNMGILSSGFYKNSLSDST